MSGGREGQVGGLDMISIRMSQNEHVDGGCDLDISSFKGRSLICCAFILMLSAFELICSRIVLFCDCQDVI